MTSDFRLSHSSASCHRGARLLGRIFVWTQVFSIMGRLHGQGTVLMPTHVYIAKRPTREQRVRILFVISAAADWLAHARRTNKQTCWNVIFSRFWNPIYRTTAKSAPINISVEFEINVENFTLPTSTAERP